MASENIAELADLVEDTLRQQTQEPAQKTSDENSTGTKTPTRSKRGKGIVLVLTLLVTVLVLAIQAGFDFSALGGSLCRKSAEKKPPVVIKIFCENVKARHSGGFRARPYCKISEGGDKNSAIFVSDLKKNNG